MIEHAQGPGFYCRTTCTHTHTHTHTLHHHPKPRHGHLLYDFNTHTHTHTHTHTYIHIMYVYVYYNGPTLGPLRRRHLVPACPFFHAYKQMIDSLLSLQLCGLASHPGLPLRSYCDPGWSSLGILPIPANRAMTSSPLCASQVEQGH